MKTSLFVYTNDIFQILLIDLACIFYLKVTATVYRKEVINLLNISDFIEYLNQKLNYIECLKQSYTKEQLKTDKALQRQLDQIYESDVVY